MMKTYKLYHVGGVNDTKSQSAQVTMPIKISLPEVTEKFGFEDFKVSPDVQQVSPGSPNADFFGFEQISPSAPSSAPASTPESAPSSAPSGAPSSAPSGVQTGSPSSAKASASSSAPSKDTKNSSIKTIAKGSILWTGSNDKPIMAFPPVQFFSLSSSPMCGICDGKKYAHKFEVTKDFDVLIVKNLDGVPVDSYIGFFHILTPLYKAVGASSDNFFKLIIGYHPLYENLKYIESRELNESPGKTVQFTIN